MAITMVSVGSLSAKAGVVGCGLSLMVIVMRRAGAPEGIISEGVVIAVIAGSSG
jgi:hypothetical protein